MGVGWGWEGGEGGRPLSTPAARRHHAGGQMTLTHPPPPTPPTPPNPLSVCPKTGYFQVVGVADRTTEEVIGQLDFHMELHFT